MPVSRSVCRCQVGKNGSLTAEELSRVVGLSVVLSRERFVYRVEFYSKCVACVNHSSDTPL